MALQVAAGRESTRGWSMSGLSLSGIFVTCAVVHLTMVLSGHRASMADWNRRPIVGGAASTRRRSPWAAGV